MFLFQSLIYSFESHQDHLKEYFIEKISPLIEMCFVSNTRKKVQMIVCNTTEMSCLATGGESTN